MSLEDWPTQLRIAPRVTGWDIGCRTLEFYVNSGVGHWVSDGGDGRLVLNQSGWIDR